MLEFTLLDDIDNRSSSGETSIVVLMCCHDRRDTTLAALHALEAQQIPAHTRVAVVLFDDGSSDGTFLAVLSAFPRLSILKGDGNAFWSRSMAAAQKYAQLAAQPDYLMWLNDDVILHPWAIGTLLSAAERADGPQVIVGSLTDALSGQTTYSGYYRIGKRPLQLQIVPASSADKFVDTFNGNVVLIPRLVYDLVGTVDRRYEHGYGDVDYGYRAVASGFPLRLASGSVGHCSRNSSSSTWLDPRVRMDRRFRLLIARKGIPPKTHFRFTRRHGGGLWLLIFGGTYIRAAFRIVYTSVRQAMLTRNEDSSGCPV